MQLGRHSISNNNICHSGKQNRQCPPPKKKGEPSGLSLPSEKWKLTEGLLSRSEWPRGRVRPPPAHRMSFRPAGVQPPRSSGMWWKMKHLTNHTLELPHPSQEWTSLLWGIWLRKPSGRPGGNGGLSELVASCLQLQVTSLFVLLACAFSFAVFTRTWRIQVQRPGLSPCHHWKILVCPDCSFSSSHQLALNSKWNIFVSAE